MELEGKVAIVTGASRGIGAAIAQELGRAGAAVAVFARSTEHSPSKTFSGTIDEVAADVRSQGVEAIAVHGDVSREEDVAAAYEETMGHFGRCDIVVNNAAVSYLAPLLDMSVKRWDLVMGVNIRGPMMMAKAFLPQMIKRGGGHIVNITSADGRLDLETVERLAESIGSTGGSFGADGLDLSKSKLAYGTSKAALNRFTVGLAHETSGTGVAVNALEVHAVTQAVRLSLPDADHSNNELPEAPGQLVAWIAQQPASFTGRILSQPDLLSQLRAKGIVRTKVSP